MREAGGYEVIKKAILNLSLRHNEHISAYGEGNERRLTGKHETASINTFSWVSSLLKVASYCHRYRKFDEPGDFPVYAYGICSILTT